MENFSKKKRNLLQQFLLRVFSTFLILGFLIAIYFFKSSKGLSFFVLITSIFVFFEYHKLAFSKLKPPLLAQGLFFLTGFLILLSGVFSSSRSSLFPFLDFFSNLNFNLNPLLSSFFTSLFSFLNTIYSFLLSLPFLSLLSFLSVLYISCSLWIFKKFSLNHTLSFLGLSHLGFFYCTFPPILLVKTLNRENGLFWFLALILIVGLHDTFAYLLGRSLGKNRLMTHISPRKTIEGLIGGILGASLGMVLLLFLFKERPPFAFLFFITLSLSLTAQFGDFFESLLKRVAKVKDSGQILPGHGGVLDRVDGFYFSVPIINIASLIAEAHF